MLPCIRSQRRTSPIACVPRKALLKAKKRRDKHPRPASLIVKPLTMKNRERDRFTRQHARILLAIETTIVEWYQQNSSLSDKDAQAALERSIRADASESAATNGKSIHDALEQALRQLFHDSCADQESRDVWRDGLRAIYSSVRTRSNPRRITAYLDYAAGFVRRAASPRLNPPPS